MTWIEYVKQLSPILNPLLTVLVAWFVFASVQRHQVQITRHGVARQLEKDIEALLANQGAHAVSANKPSDLEFRAVLDNRAWNYVPDELHHHILNYKAPKCIQQGPERWWLIRSADAHGVEQYLSSRLFHETLLWFRRIEQAYADEVIKPKDLCAMWRFTLPIAFCQRLHYFSRYFEGEQDIEAMVNVVNATLKHCLQRRWTSALIYFSECITDDDRRILERRRRDRRMHRKILRIYEKIKTKAALEVAVAIPV